MIDIRNIKKDFRSAVHKQDMKYGMFGSMFRSGSRQEGFEDLSLVKFGSKHLKEPFIEKKNFFTMCNFTMPFKDYVCHADYAIW